MAASTSTRTLHTGTTVVYTQSHLHSQQVQVPGLFTQGAQWVKHRPSKGSWHQTPHTGAGVIHRSLHTGSTVVFTHVKLHQSLHTGSTVVYTQAQLHQSLHTSGTLVYTQVQLHQSQHTGSTVVYAQIHLHSQQVGAPGLYTLLADWVKLTTSTSSRPQCLYTGSRVVIHRYISRASSHQSMSTGSTVAPHRPSCTGSQVPFIQLNAHSNQLGRHLHRHFKVHKANRQHMDWNWYKTYCTVNRY
jgi:hypothetical protein